MSKAFHVEVNERKYLVTENNELVDMESWDQDIRDWLADQQALDLNQERLDAIEFIRSTYMRRRQHPNPRVIVANLAKQHGEDKNSLKYFYTLFPRGVQQAVAIAGVPLKGLCF